MLMIKQSKGRERGISFSVSHGRLSFPYSLLFSLFIYAPWSLVKVLDAFMRTKWKQLQLNNGRSPFSLCPRRSVVAKYLPCDSLPCLSASQCCIDNIQIHCKAENTLLHETKALTLVLMAESLQGPFWGFLHLFQSPSEDQAAPY